MSGPPEGGTPTPRCVVCGAVGGRVAWSVDATPIHPLRAPGELRDADAFGRLVVVECGGCGHLRNAAFEPGRLYDLYSALVLTNQPVSTAMLRAVESTAALILRHARPKPSVLEIGGGHGALAVALARHAGEVHLVEPSRAVRADSFAGTGVTFHHAMFPTPQLGPRRFDAVACRQVVEHVPEPEPFLAALRAAMADDGIAYLELPSAEYIRLHLSLVDFHYPHVHYYLRGGIEALLARVGLAVVDVVDLKGGHDRGFLLRAAPPAPDATPPEAAGQDWSGGMADLRIRGRQALGAVNGAIALYGANAYAQALLGLYPDVGSFAVMFDDTPSYRGRQAYGRSCSIPIEPPSAERLRGIAAVVITAYLHDLDIARKVRALGFAGRLYTVRTDPGAGRGDVPPSLFR